MSFVKEMFAAESLNAAFQQVRMIMQMHLPVDRDM